VKYKAVIFDIDGTITRHISSWRLIHERLGMWDKIAFRYQKQFLAGKISYRKFCELDAAHWKGLPEAKIRNVFKSIQYTKNAVMCIRKLKKSGFKLIAVSTGLQYVPEKIKKDLGFDHVLSNSLKSSGGKMTGRVRINIPHGGKGAAVKRILKKFGIRRSHAISVGDTAGDIPMARATGYSIAFNSTDKKLLRTVNYRCRTRDFREIYNIINTISSKKV